MENNQEKEYVLIVDDLAIDRKILSRNLQAKYGILEASNGNEALKILSREKNIVCILLDLVMPEMDGFEFLKEYSLMHLFEIPIIVITADNNEEIEEKALSLGASDFFYKPFDMNILVLKIDNNIKKNEIISMRSYAQRLEYDQLTGIYSTGAFYMNAKKYIEANSFVNLAVVCTDIFEFTHFNTVFGKEQADKILIKQANMIKEKCERYGLPYGRFENDSFCFICPVNFLEKEIKHKDYKVLEYRVGIDYRLKVSFGIYVINDYSVPFDLMCQYALMATKEVRMNEDNNYAYFDDQMIAIVKEQEEIVTNMEKALRNEEFLVYYQPIVAINSKNIVSCEALVRWKTKTKGIKSPGIFIPLFEKNGFIIKLDRYVWKHVCIDIRKSIDDGNKVIPVSVNISRIDFYNSNIVKDLDTMLETYNVPKDLFRVEVTESAFQENPDHIIKIAKEFKDSGYTILMDDFGTGYSSLESLEDIPVDILKLDMRFMRNLGINSKSSIIVSSILRMCKLLGIKVVAEGVENDKQMEFLKSIGCEYGQGYYYSRPIPRENFLELINKNNGVLISNKEKSVDLKAIWDVEANLSSLFNNMVTSMGVYQYSKENGLNIVRVNNAYYTVVGGKEPNKYLDPNIPFREQYNRNKDAFDQILRKAKETNNIANGLIRDIKYDGTEFIGYITVKYIGSVAIDDEYLFSISDVTEEENNNETLVKLNQILGVMNCELASLRITNDEVRIIDEVRKLESLAFIGVDANILDVVIPEERLRIMSTLKEMCIDHRPRHMTMRLNISVCHLYSLNVIAYDASREDDHYLCKVVIFDNSEDIEAVDSILRNIPVPFYIINEDNNEILFMNDLFKDKYQVYDNNDKKCYEVIFGKNMKCMNCFISENKCDPFDGNVTDLEGRHIKVYSDALKWNGISSRICFLLDESEQYSLMAENEMLLQNNPGFIIKFRLDLEKYNFTIEAIKGRVFDLLGFTDKEFMEMVNNNKNVFASIEERDYAYEVIKELLKSGTAVSNYIRYNRRDGSNISLSMYLSIASRTNQQVIFYASVVDSSGEYEKYIGLREINKRYKALVQDFCTITFDYNYEEDTLDFETVNEDGNSKTEKMIGYLAHIIDSETIHDISKQVLHDNIMKAKTGDGKGSFKIFHNVFSNGFRWGLVFCRTVVDETTNELHLLGRVDDITEFENNTEKMLLEANADYLTGLPTRKFFEGIVKKEYSQLKNSYLVFLDIDHFKSINDKYGHNNGDKALKKIAKAIKKNIRFNDLACRYGGDEFIIIYRNMSCEEDVLEKVTSIQEAYKRFLIESDFVDKKSFTISFGIEKINVDESYENMFIRVDKEMYENKGSR